MITTTFTDILDSNNVVIGRRLTIWYNNKLVNTLDYPANAEMSVNDLDTYIAGKLSGVLS